MRRRVTAVAVATGVIALSPALLMGASALAAGTQAGAGTTASAASASWHAAEEVPGTAVLNAGGEASTQSVSCASAGNCSAGGYYLDATGSQQAFVVNETNGTWGTAKEVPGTAALDTGGEASTQSVSCVSAGNCSAGGYYQSISGQQAFVVNETNGTWSSAQEVPGTAALNTGGRAQVNSVSCATAGTCNAGGFYINSSGTQAFVASEKNGTWGTAEQVPGSAALNVDEDAAINSVSCGSAGDCSAGGYYTDGSGHRQALFVNERDDTWGTAKEVPGTAALNAGGDAQINSLSCASAGNCGAGGSYQPKNTAPQPFVVTESDAAWGSAVKVTGIAALSGGNDSQVTSVSCATAGSCSAGGIYTDTNGGQQVFVVGETNGTWGSAEEVPGTAALNTGTNANLNSVSCVSAGNCTVGGNYQSKSSGGQALVVTETNGTWGNAREVPGTAALNKGGFAMLNSVSCATAGNCGAGGSYVDSSGLVQAFVASKS